MLHTERTTKLFACKMMRCDIKEEAEEDTHQKVSSSSENSIVDVTGYEEKPVAPQEPIVKRPRRVDRNTRSSTSGSKLGYKCVQSPETTKGTDKHICPDPLETLYRCSQCPYQTKRKNDMPKHLLAHCSNVQMYKCPECPYQTKRKCDLPKHLLCHRPMETVPVYQCSVCDYKTKRKGDLPKHELNHRDKSELNYFQCTECKYLTKRKNDLHKHMLVHSNRLVNGIFKCLKCTYATDKVNKFSKHVLSNCSYSVDPISMEHLMLEDILASVDNDDFHVVLEDDEAEEEEDSVPVESNVTVDVTEKPGVFRFSVGEFTIDLDAANPPTERREREVPLLDKQYL